MRRWRVPALVVGGGLVGAVITALTLGALWPLHPAVLQRLPDPLLARVLMAQTASTIVHDTRRPGAPSAGISLYSRPTPVSESLCLVRVFYFDRARSTDPSDGPSNVTEFYALLKEPVGAVGPSDVVAAPAGPDSTAEFARKGCADYRDFDHLIAGGRHEIAEVLYLLQQSRIAAVRGVPTFNINCVSKIDHREGRPCDGLAYVRSLRLKTIGEVWRASGLGTTEDGARTYWVTVTDYGHGHPIVTKLTVSTHARSDSPGDRIKSINIERDTF